MLELFFKKKKKIDHVFSADFIIFSVKHLLLLTEHAISVIHWHVLSIHTILSILSICTLKIQDIKIGYFYFEILPKEICTLFNVVRVSMTFTEVMQKLL